MARSARWQEQRRLAADLRHGGSSAREIAALLRDRYGVNARLALRTARGLSQADVAAEWNERWPDEPKTFKNVSYWEVWPSRTGHAPSLVVLDRLARIYGCDVTDLLAGWGEHGPADPEPEPAAEAAALAWQVEHLDLHELARATADWAGRLPSATRRALLLKLSTATAVAAAPLATDDGSRSSPRPASRPAELAGRWTSSYMYRSTGRDTELTGEHRVELDAQNERLVGHGLPTDTGSLTLDLRVDGMLVSGSWTERTSPSGYYKGAVYHGILLLIADPTGRSMTGMWLGPDRDFVVGAGPWNLTRGWGS